MHALLSSDAELPLTVHATSEVLCLQCSKAWLHLAVHIMHNKIATDSEGVDMWRVSNDSATLQKQHTNEPLQSGSGRSIYTQYITLCT